MEREPATRRSNSLHAGERGRMQQEMEEFDSNQKWVEMQKGTLRTKPRSVSFASILCHEALDIV